MLNVSLKLSRGSFVLDLAFTAPTGSVIALFGPSGCGKSTTANLLAGLLTPDHGHISLNDQTLFDSTRQVNLNAEQRDVGYVFQEPRLFPHFNVAMNLRYGLKRTRAAHFIDFDSVVKLLDLQSMLTRHPSQLSGGEQQRVAIGRALLSQPKLLLLDEPLSSLDMARRNEVLPYLERLRDSLKITILYVSHQFEEVLRLATHVVLMNKGQCIAQGSLNQLSLQPEFRALLNEEAIGAIIDTRVESIDARSGLAQLVIGNGILNIDATGLIVGQPVRVQLPSRDLILSLQPPSGLSIRNQLAGVITQLSSDNDRSMLVHVDVDGAIVMAHITHSAALELELKIGTRLWVLVKAITLRGHVFPATEKQFPINV